MIMAGRVGGLENSCLGMGGGVAWFPRIHPFLECFSVESGSCTVISELGLEWNGMFFHTRRLTPK